MFDNVWGLRLDSWSNSVPALDGFWLTVEKTGTGTGRIGTGPVKISYRSVPNGSRSFTVYYR